MSLIAVIYAVPHDARSHLVCRILEAYQIPYRVYTEPRWRGLGSKLDVAYRATQDLTDYSHLLFLDAYDVVVLAGVQTIFERYTTFAHPWVCNADPHIWPPGSVPPDDYPPCDTPWGKLNSGAYLAERTYVHDTLKRWGVPEMTRWNFCDQGWLAQHYVKKPETICLDTQCVLFQCLIGGWWAFEVSPGRLHNTVTNTDPVILHHNGGGKLTEDRMVPLYAHLV